MSPRDGFAAFLLSFHRGAKAMDINAGLIDQRVNAIVDKRRQELVGALGPSARNDPAKLKSAAFTVLCLETLLSLDEDGSLDCITDGSDDAGVDAMHLGDLVDGEFPVTIVQSKYAKALDGLAGYPANAVVRVILTLTRMFDPDARLAVNPRLEQQIAEVRSLIIDGNIPEVRVVLASNGKAWESNGQAEIDASGLTSKRVTFQHVNHDTLVGLLQKKKSIDAHLKLSGKALVEDFDFRRVLVGRLPVAQVRDLFDAHGDTLLDRNIRKYLGLKDNRVNLGIHQTLVDPERRNNFYFFNNGITAICTKFSYNALQSENWDVNIKGLQIVNGGQTSKTIQRTLQDYSAEDYSKAFVLLRLYELASEEDALINNITFATNSQNPVDLTDLRSNDVIQEKLAIGLRDLGFEYRRKRDEQSTSAPDVITSTVAGEAVMAAWKRRPNAAKFRRSKLFSELYDEVFSADLQAAHVILSVLAFRLVETERKRPKRKLAKFVPYGSHFLAMVVLDLLLEKAGRSRPEVTHANLPELRELFEVNRVKLYMQAVTRVSKALRQLGVKRDTPLPRVAAQFRRGDLLEPLQKKLELRIGT